MSLPLMDYHRIRSWFYRNARPLDLARWRFHFEEGPLSAVLEALSAYQNEDGGFGHALEADSWNPNSTPIQTATAVEKLLEVHFDDPTHPIVQGMLRYLDSGAEMDEGIWRNVVDSNNDYPHAPWWHTDSNSTARSMYNPTAILAGAILKFADRDSRLYEQGMQTAKDLAGRFLEHPDIEMHPLKCVLTMLECISAAKVEEHFAYPQLIVAARAQIAVLLARGAVDWNGYSCRPSAFIKTPDSLGAADHAALVQQELDYILGIRNPEGVWNLTWSWAAYENEFAVAENWWKASIAIENLLLLQAFKGLGYS
ncbi:MULTISPECIES: hypothetical protein [Paenibacillus]|uniref:Squalene cyclase C-terminal domain-containing protein n=1 Tax=Paenibacillus borealis TaxID=160799 RepID=A0ABX3H6C6_PAEBO|nr:hypothetical protein [Paenibacillus borealis]OMD45542.1 hypothetical protein BSK56_19330 [Paenibacillus borealis]